MAELLWERGYAATSPRDVLARAGVGKAACTPTDIAKYADSLSDLLTEAVKVR
jgi:hypothetical protein